MLPSLDTDRPFELVYVNIMVETKMRVKVGVSFFRINQSKLSVLSARLFSANKRNKRLIFFQTTGIPLKVSAKFQINILLEPSKTVT